MKNHKFGNRKNLLISTSNQENNTATASKIRRAFKSRLAALCMLLALSVFAAIFGFVGNFAPINTIEEKDNTTAYAAVADDWKTVATSGGTLTLSANWIASSLGTDTTCFKSGALLVPSGKNVTIDLNGFTISRGLTATTAYGAIIYVQSNATLTIKDSKGGGIIRGGFSKTTGDYGGGCISVCGGTFNFQSGTLTGNQTSGSTTGAAINLSGGSILNMSGGTITGNTATSTTGSIVSIIGTSRLNITGGAIKSNTISGATGSGIYIGSTYTANFHTISGLDLSSNTFSGNNSGALNIVSASRSAGLTNCTIKNNTFSGTGSAAVRLASVSTSYITTFTGCTISGNTNNNTSNYGAGGILLYSSALCRIENNTTISGNTAKGTLSAGGVTIGASCTFAMTGGSITGNTGSNATSGCGGILIQGNTTSIADLQGGEISSNKGGYTGGVYVVTNGVIKVRGAIKITANTLSSSTTTKANVKFASTSAVENDAGYITVSAALTSGASIGVTKTGNNYVPANARITNGLASYNSTAAATDFFTLDNAGSDYNLIRINTSTGAQVTSGGEAAVFSYNNQQNWEDAIAASTSVTDAKTFILYSDWTVSGSFSGNLSAAYTSGALYINSSKKIIIDLNSHKINRNCSSYTATGYVLDVRGSVEIKDSGSGGQITGGRNSSAAGGGVYFRGTEFRLSGGSITGNYINAASGTGAGLYIYSGAAYMTGGSIANNYVTGASGLGGGVYLNTGTFTFSGGTISGNTANGTTAGQGGGIYNYNGTLNLTGGTITGNSAAKGGAGVAVKTDKVVNISGGINVYGNTYGSVKSNIYLEGNTQKLTITAALTNTTPIGISRTYSGEFTTNWNKYNSGKTVTSYFSSDSSDMFIVFDSATNEVALMSTDNANNWVSAVSNSKADGKQRTVILAKDWVASSGSFGTDTTAYINGGLFVPSGANVLLDLAGYKLNRNSFGTARSSPIIQVEGTLEIIDSSTAKTGQITGGNSNYASSTSYKYRAGGIQVYGGTLTMRGGTITNCTANSGYGAGGVQLYSSALFTMYGGSITGCSHTAAAYGAGGLSVVNSTFNFYGGSITNNTAVNYTSKIDGNSAGVWVSNDTNSKINIQGDITCSGNKFTDNTGADVVLQNTSGTMTVMGALTGEHKVGFRRAVDITSAPNGSTFTSYFASRSKVANPETYFFASYPEAYALVTGKTEGTITCVSNEINWTNVYNNGSGTVKLTSDWLSDSDKTFGKGAKGYSSGALYVNGATVTLDLAGHTIDRRLTSATASGFVIYMRSGSLTIIDTVGGGKITGGFNNAATGGGIYHYGGTLYLNGGEITGNKSSAAGGGGVHVRNNTCVLNIGGSAAVYGNTASFGTSNIYFVDETQTMTVNIAMTNTAHKTGVYRDKSGAFTTGFATKNKNQQAEDYFTSDIAIYYIVNRGAGEAALTSTDNSTNWKDAVADSLNNSGATQTVKLQSDWTPNSSYSFGDDTDAYINGVMYVKLNVNIILDLNGHTINRKLTSARDYGCLFYIYRGSLTITDTSVEKTGQITGGYNNSSYYYGAGAIYVQGASGANGILTLQGGTITGNKSATGGAAIISYNTYGVVRVSGDAKVEGNTINNTTTQANVLMRTQTQALTVIGKLNSGAHIGITRPSAVNNYNGNGEVFTSGYRSYNYVSGSIESPDKYFFSDSANYIVVPSNNLTQEAKLLCTNNALNWNNALTASSSTNKVTFMLYSDWDATYNSSYTTSFQPSDLSSSYFTNGALYVSSGKNVVLDLNGHTLNRKLTASRSNGYVIYVAGSGILEIMDSVGGGNITGGYNKDGTGGVMVTGTGTLTMKSGKISGNYGSNGAGVYIDTNANLNLGGSARIEGNKKLSNLASNIYLTGLTKKINIVSKVDTGINYGLTRASTGAVTAGWNTYNKGIDATDFFQSEDSDYGIILDSANEATLVSAYNDINWQSAVALSLDSKGATQEVRLFSTWTATGGNFGTGTGFYNGGLFVPSGASIKLDMNGFSIDRALKSAISYGGVFRIYGTLTIVNTSTTESTITGGYCNYQSDMRGGGIFVAAGGSVTISGVTITGNKTSSNNCAGGIYVYNGAQCILTDATVKNNEGTLRGGVALESGSTFTVGGKTVIEGNTILSNNVRQPRDVCFVSDSAYIYASKLTEGAHIGVFRLVNNYSASSNTVVTKYYGSNNRNVPAETYFFASDTPNHKVLDLYATSSTSNEVRLYCTDYAQNWYNACYASSTSNVTTFRLESDWDAASDSTYGTSFAGTNSSYVNAFYNGALRLRSGQCVIIDLNGYKINRGLEKVNGYGAVIYSWGNLTVIDSSAGNTGEIRGGYTNNTTYPASGIQVISNTTRITGGNITGNQGGYGVSVRKNSFLELGGKVQIYGNTKGSAAANLNLEYTTNIIKVVSKLTAVEAEGGNKLGITKLSNGLITNGFGQYHTARPSNYFVSENNEFFVTYTTSIGARDCEGELLSSNQDLNWAYAVNQSISNNGATQTFRLLADWTPNKGTNGANDGRFGTDSKSFKQGALYVPSNASVILDLDGYKIDKQGVNYSNRQCIIYVDGKLEIKDSSDEQTGLITGGLFTHYYGYYYSYGYDRSACINVRNGTVTMRGGKIAGNKTKEGYNYSYSGAGVYVWANGTFDMYGGEITDNEGYVAGGVYVAEGGKFRVGESAKVYNNYRLLLNGDRRKDPEGKDVFSDVYLENANNLVYVVKKLNTDAKIGIAVDPLRIKSNGTAVTSGWQTYNSGSNPTDSVFYSCEPTEYLMETAKVNGRTEAVIYCTNNNANWANAVQASLDSNGATQNFRLYSNWYPDANVTLVGSYQNMFGDKTGYRYGALRVPSGASIILDLHGFNIDRQLAKAVSNGFVIRVEGTLKIIDSTVPETGAIQQGSITGGWNTGDGGAIYVASGATLTVTGGNITGNQTNYNGGGICVHKNGTLNLGGTARVNGNRDKTGANPSNIYLYGTTQLITITEPMRFDDGETNCIGVMRGTVNSSTHKPDSMGQLTSGWGKYNEGIDPEDVFFGDNKYIRIASEEDGKDCEAIILSNNNLDNWVYAVTRSLSTGKTTKFILVENWTSSRYLNYSNYYATSFGQTANCFKNGGLLVPAGASIVVDLNGNTLNRAYNSQMTSYTSGGYVYYRYNYNSSQYAAFNYAMYIQGSVQIVDSSEGKSGRITGGYDGLWVAEGGFVCIGALPDGVGNMPASKYIVQDNGKYGGGTISGNSRYGVYGTAGTFVMTNGRIEGNSSAGVFMNKIEATDEDPVEKLSTVMLGGKAYIYTTSSCRDLYLQSDYQQVQIVTPFQTGAQIGFYRDTMGQITSGWGSKNGNDNTPLNYFTWKGTNKYVLETETISGSREVFLNTYDNALNWQYAVSTSLSTGQETQFDMYSCWTAEKNSRYGTSFGSTSAFKNGALYVPAGAKVVLNMNGHKLDRNLTNGVSSGYVIYVDGTLTIRNVIKPDPVTDAVLPSCGATDRCDRNNAFITGGYNTSGSSAGAIYIGSKGIVTMAHEAVTIKDNKATSTSSTAGAVYVASGGTFNFVIGTINNNTGSTAGGVYVATGGKFDMPKGSVNPTLSGNNGSGAGAGAVYTAGEFNMASGTISGNTSMIGGIYIANNGKVTISDGASITNNTGNSAGAIFVSSSETAELTITGGSILSNKAVSAGGIYTAGKVTMTGGTIRQNTATGDAAGDKQEGGSGIFIAGSGNVTITGGEITQNVGLNGVRVHSSGTLNLGESAKIYNNISNSKAFIEKEDVDKDGIAYNDVFLTAVTRKINIIGKFNADANVGIYREGSGVFTKNYGEKNAEHPNNTFFSNNHHFTIAATVPEEDNYVEAVMGIPVAVPEQYLVDGEAPIYNGNWQQIITGYDTDKMECEVLDEEFVQLDIITDSDGNVIIKAVDAGSYVIAFTLKTSYCWEDDGSIGPKQIHVEIMPKPVAVTWHDETHTDESGNTVNCKYDGETDHGPSATIDRSQLCTNVLNDNKLDECSVDVVGRTTSASGVKGHTATAIYPSNPNYTLIEETATHTFYVEKAELPAFTITTEQIYFKTACNVEVGGNIESGKLHYSLPEAPANVTINESTGEIYTSNTNRSVPIKVKVVVDETDNYKSAEAVRDIEVLPGKVDTKFKVTEVAYGETLTLELEGYDSTTMGAVTYSVHNQTGIGKITGDQLTAQKAGEVEVTAIIAARGDYFETTITGQFKLTPRLLELNWTKIEATYDGNYHAPAVDIVASAKPGYGLLDADKTNFALTLFSKVSHLPVGNGWINAGEYHLELGLSSTNYALADEKDNDKIFTIHKAEINPTFASTVAEYKKQFTPQINGNPGNGAVTFTVAEADADKVQVSGNSFTPLAIGKITITAHVAESVNYKEGTVTAEFTVGPTEMELTLTTATTVYGDNLTLAAVNQEEEAVNATFSVDANDVADVVDGVLIPKNVGTVTVKMSAPATEKFKEAIDKTATVTVTPREVEIIWSDLTFVYNKTGRTPTAEVKASDLVNGDTCVVSSVTVEGFAEAVNVGTYNAVASVLKSTNAVNGVSTSNYVAKEASLKQQFTIKPFAAQISWGEKRTFVYNGSEQAPEAKITNAYAGDTPNVNVLGTKDAAENLVAMAIGVDDPNYTLEGITNPQCEYTITPLPSTISWSNTVLTYNGSMQQPTGTVNELFEGDECEVTVMGAQTNVGNYTAEAIGLSNSNYVLKEGISHTTQFSIERGEINIFLNNSPATYGEFYNLSLQNDYGGTVTYTVVAGDEKVILTGNRLLPMDIGVVTVTATLAESENFLEATDTQEIRILQRPVALEWNNLTFEYDKDSHIPTVRVSNLVNSDSCLVTVEGEQIDAGHYTAVATGITNGKYTLAGGLNIQQAFDITALDITIVWDEDNVDFTYNGLMQHPSLTIEGLLEGDTCEAVIEGATNAMLNQTATVISISNSNYTLANVTNKSIEFNIHQLPVELSWTDLQLVYNGNEQGPSATVTNLCGTDVCTVTVEGWQVDVGDYVATANGLSNNNYTLYRPETGETVDEDDDGLVASAKVDFKIKKADRSFDLAEKSTVYGTELYLAVTGLEDDVEPAFSVKDGSGSAYINDEGMLVPTAAGTVTVTVSVPETPNFNGASVPFEVTIEKYAVVIEWECPEFIYDGNPHAPTAIVTNPLEISEVEGEDGEITIIYEECTVLEVSGAIHAGNAHVASVTKLSNPNYTVEGGTNVTTTFSISPKPVSIEWNTNAAADPDNEDDPDADFATIQFVYNGSPQGPDAHVTGLVGDDTCSVVTTGKNINAGTYTARAVSLGNPDYTLDGAIGLTHGYTIVRADPEITITTKNAILGIKQPIEITGNIGGGTVNYYIIVDDENDGSCDHLSEECKHRVESCDLAYISGSSLISQKVGTVTVCAEVGETINTNLAYAIGEIKIEKGKAPLALERTNVTYGNTLPLIVDDNDGFLRDDYYNLIFGDVTFKIKEGEEDRAIIEIDKDGVARLRPLKADVGSVVHVIMSTEETKNFEATDVEVTINVAQRVVILSWTEENFTYNKKEQKPTATVTNLISYNGKTDECIVTVQGATDAGSHTATAISLSNPCYTLEGANNKTKPYVIAPLPVKIEWGALSKQFNGEHQYPDASVKTIDDEPCTVVLEGGGIDAGFYDVHAAGLSNHNYILVPENLDVRFEITRAHITPVLSPTTAVYKQEVTLKLTGNLENGAVTYTVLEDESEGRAEIDGNKFLPTKAGNVVVKINIAETKNCYAYEGKVTITVEKAPRSGVTLIKDTAVYGETVQLAITGNDEESGTVSYGIFAGADKADIDENNVLITKHAGQATIEVTIGETDNYAETIVRLPFTITKRPVEIEWTDTEFIYDGNTHKPKARVTNLVGDDKCDITVTVTDGNAIDAGTHQASVSMLTNSDYSYTNSITAHVVYTIGKKEIHITLDQSHIVINKIEGLSIQGNEGNMPVTYTVENGTGTATIVDGEGTADESGQYIKGTRLGAIIVTAHVPEAKNHLSAEVRTLVIIEKDRPVIELENTEVMYGGLLDLVLKDYNDGGRITYSIANDTGSAALTADGKLRPIKVGVVNVTISVGASTNYSAGSTTIEVTITPKPITGLEWSTNNEFTYDGLTEWAPTAKALGLINNDTCEVVVGGGQINAGTWRTAFAKSLSNPNYKIGDLNNQGPTFVVNKIKPTIKILTTAATIGVPTIIEISGNNDNAVPTFILENGTGTATLSGSVITGTSLGEVYVTVSVPETTNYLFGSASGIIVIEKPAAPVDLLKTVAQYGTDLTLSVLGNLENGDVSLELKETELAELNGNVLTPKGVGEVTVIVTVAETASYKETVKEITVTIKPRPIEVSWEKPEFTYEKTEHKPTATITNLLEGDECSFEVSGYINAGTDCPAYVYNLSNPNYTVEGGTDVNTTFVIKPRPVALSWEENCVFTYNGEVQTPKATVTDALEGDTVNINKIDGSKDIGEDLVATAKGTDNSNYTVEGGTNLTTTYAIRAYEIDDPDVIQWGELTAVYTGQATAPKAYFISSLTGEEVLCDVQGSGIHVSQDPYIARIVGVLSPNYVLSESILNDLSVSQREYYITPATVTFDEEVLKKEYNGEEQQPEFTVHLLAPDDDLYIEVTGGGTAVAQYNVELTLMGASTGDYVLAEADKTKLFEIVRKALTLKVTAKDREEKYTNAPVDTSHWTNWYTTALEGLLEADAGKSLEDLFTSNTLTFVPRIFESLDDETTSSAIEKGNYFILPAYTSGEVSGAENYEIKVSDIAYESGTLTVGGKIYLELTDESPYQFVYEKIADLGFRYLRAYAEDNMVHGVDDVNFSTFVLGQIPLETTVKEFLKNFKNNTFRLVSNKNIVIIENGQPAAGYESVLDDDSFFVGTGWHIEYGEEDALDIVYLSVLGDLNGDGTISTSDTSILSTHIERNKQLDLWQRLAAMLANKGALSAIDLSAMSVVMENGNSEIFKYYTYKD